MIQLISPWIRHFKGQVFTSPPFWRHWTTCSRTVYDYSLYTLWDVYSMLVQCMKHTKFANSQPLTISLCISCGIPRLVVRTREITAFVSKIKLSQKKLTTPFPFFQQSHWPMNYIISSVHGQRFRHYPNIDPAMGQRTWTGWRGCWRPSPLIFNRGTAGPDSLSPADRWFWIAHPALRIRTPRHIPPNTTRPPNVDLMFGQRLRRWPNINSTSGKYLVFAGVVPARDQQRTDAGRGCTGSVTVLLEIPERPAAGIAL